jgi:hypothetical protein
MENNNSVFLYDLAIHPGRGLRRVREHRPWILLVAIVILSEISLATGVSLFVSNFTGVGRNTFFLNLFLTIILFTVFWIIKAGILHFFAELWGKRGSAIDLFITLGLAMFPFIFVSPLSLIVEGLGRGRILVQSIFTTFVLLWCFFLVLAGIREVYSSSTFEALLILLTPFLLMTMLFIFLPLGYILLTVLSLSL